MEESTHSTRTETPGHDALCLGMDTRLLVVTLFLMALGLNIVVGYAGLLDLGYAAFFAIGAYTTGMIASPHFGISLSFWLAIWIAAAVAPATERSDRGRRA